MVDKTKSKLADTFSYPQIVDAQTAVTDPTTVTLDGTFSNTEVAAAINASNTKIIAILDALRAHGLIKT